MTVDEIHAAIRELPPRERLRLVVRVIHEIVESMADEHELDDEGGAQAMARDQRGSPR